MRMPEPLEATKTFQSRRDARRDFNPALTATILSLVLTAAHAQPSLQYFRSDAGVATGPGQPLPANLGDTNVLRWRVPVDPGHSTPMIFSNRIVLTTYRADRRELATEALDRDSGKPLWRRVAVRNASRPFIPPRGARPRPARRAMENASSCSSGVAACSATTSMAGRCGNIAWDRSRTSLVRAAHPS